MSGAQLRSIIAQVINVDISRIPQPPYEILSFAALENTDEIAEITYYIQNQNLVTDAACAELVAEQLAKFKVPAMAAFELSDLPANNTSFEQRWGNYLNKLDLCLAQVEYRVKHKFSYNTILPPLRQILTLQQECWNLTCEYYGEGLGNLSSFYTYYIRMCEAARITRYKYAQITKYLSADKYTAHINLEQRKNFIQQHAHEILQQYCDDGGVSARGRTEIDATSISNVYYYKAARQRIFFLFAQQTIVDLLGLEEYGQLAVQKKHMLWQLIKEHLPADTAADRASIFYQFAEFCNDMPGACFDMLPAQLTSASNIPQYLLHKLVKFAGIKSGKLWLLDRTRTEDWTPKRYLVTSWQRKYALLNLRPAGKLEHMRIVPNEMPYASIHGMSLCGDGLREGLAEHASWLYSWNLPVDVREEIGNAARDIEKLFRELKFVCPHPGKKLLPGETLLNIFQNTVAYSTQRSQHTHITQGTIEIYPIYMLPPVLSKYSRALDATIALVQVGSKRDAMFVRVEFDNLENEAVIKFVLNLYHSMYQHFKGSDHIDAFIQIFPTSDGKYVFIFEPHVFLKYIDNNEFLNTDTKEISMRKPFWFIPQGANIFEFPTDNPLAEGLPFLRKFYDSTCKHGVYDFIVQQISRLT